MSATRLRSLVPLRRWGTSGADGGRDELRLRGQGGGAAFAGAQSHFPSRRLLGAFYTPDGLARTLTEWALAERSGHVLDPSFGGCAFLRAAVDVLRAKRVKSPRALVHGIDIDPKCQAFARDIIPSTNHTTADFLSIRPNTLLGFPFTAIVGNPPYVRHHWLKGRKRAAAHGATTYSGLHLPRTASTWAYFVLHALHFLAPGGRLALLVPEAILQSQYGKAVRKALQWRFSSVRLIHVRERVFSQTNEPVVVIAAQGRGPGSVRVLTAPRVSEVAEILHRPLHALRLTTSNARPLATRAKALLSEISRAKPVRQLQELATVRIGVVTGANDFFVRSLDDIQDRGLPQRFTRPVVARTRWLTGLDFTERDHATLTAQGRRTLLIHPTPGGRSHPAIREWVAEGAEAGISHRHKCEIREPWYDVRQGPTPDGFVTCSRLGSPLLVLNRSRCRCTNALHSLYWRSSLPIPEEAVAVAFLTSAVALEAELTGRRYGGGVLKTEPGAVGHFNIPVTAHAGNAYAEINAIMRAGSEEEARQLADRIVLHDGLGLSSAEIRVLAAAARTLLRQRVPVRRGAVDA